MSALPCAAANPFAEADQTYAAISGFLRSKEACQVNHSELERELEGMGRDLLRKSDTPRKAGGLMSWAASKA
ncbi:MAG: hypothetical protein LC126_15000, partial [Bryobacterales bacterium]|nr:hypothetical protein [Bryobacterales bacterium]